MDDNRIYACLVVHGVPVYVRFDDERQFSRMYHNIDRRVDILVSVTGQDNKTLWVRPSSVDLLVKGAQPNGE